MLARFGWYRMRHAINMALTVRHAALMVENNERNLHRYLEAVDWDTYLNALRSH